MIQNKTAATHCCKESLLLISLYIEQALLGIDSGFNVNAQCQNKAKQSVKTPLQWPLWCCSCFIPSCSSSSPLPHWCTWAIPSAQDHQGNTAPSSLICTSLGMLSRDITSYSILLSNSVIVREGCCHNGLLEDNWLYGLLSPWWTASGATPAHPSCFT